MKKPVIFTLLMFASFVHSQENIKYQKPSQEILDLVEYERAPSVLYDDKKTHMIFGLRAVWGKKPLTWNKPKDFF